MRRRALLAAMLWPLLAESRGSLAQKPAVPTVGFLFVGDPERSAWWLEAWRKGMAEEGFVEGRNFRPEYRWGKGDVTRLPAFAADLVRREVDVIVTTSEQGALAARQATTKIPIVFNFIADPVRKGLVKSFANPGGNITGIADPDEGSMESKRLQLLHEAMPGIRRIGYLIEEQISSSRRVETVATAGKTLGVDVVLLAVDRPEGIDLAFAAAKQGVLSAVLVQAPATLLYAQKKRILEAAAYYAMPVASGHVDFAAGGGLLEYSFIRSEVASMTAKYVGRILTGERPDRLPIQHAARTEFVLNLKAARALGLALPAALVGRADQVIE